MARQQSGNRPELQAVESRRRYPLTEQDSWVTYSPFGMMRRLADEMDRLSEGFPMTRGRLYSPEIDMVERDGKLVVRADLPGMTKDDVTVDITQNTVVIEGERKYEHESNESGIYRTERSYGRFRREIPLPEGVKTENATATFKDGVLEVSVDASQVMKNRRRIKIA